MRIVITISDPLPEFDHCSLSLESRAVDSALYATIARRTDGTWSVISIAPYNLPNLLRFKPAPVVTVDVKP